MLGALVAVSVARVAEALVAIAAGEGPAAGVNNRVLHHVGLGLGHVAAVPALTGRQLKKKHWQKICMSGFKCSV